MPSVLTLAHCGRCGSYSFPAAAHGCRRCGASGADLAPVACPQEARLIDFITLHTELAPGLPVPCVIGEVELAPGVVEEAWIDVPDESSLQPGLRLSAQCHDTETGPRWSFVPIGVAP